MAKDVCKMFPNITQKVRRGRGVTADVKLSSFPTFRELFEGITSTLIAYKADIKEEIDPLTHVSASILAMYHNTEDGNDKIGIVNHHWCFCESCGGHPIHRCVSGAKLHALANSIAMRIHWFENLELCMSQLCIYTSDMEWIGSVIDHFFHLENDRKLAIIAQRKLIDQRRQILFERAQERAQLFRRRQEFNEINLDAFLNQPVQFNNMIVGQVNIAQPMLIVNEPPNDRAIVEPEIIVNPENE